MHPANGSHMLPLCSLKGGSLLGAGWPRGGHAAGAGTCSTLGLCARGQHCTVSGGFTEIPATGKCTVVMLGAGPID